MLPSRGETDTNTVSRLKIGPQQAWIFSAVLSVLTYFNNDFSDFSLYFPDMKHYWITRFLFFFYDYFMGTAGLIFFYKYHK